MILILGAKGLLGGYLKDVFSGCIGWDRDDVDIINTKALGFKIEQLKNKPSVIINCVAYNDVDGAESNQELAFKLNRDLVKGLANLSNKLDATLVHFSTNYVFDGQAGEYAEDAEPKPLSVYGKSKYEGELVLAKKAKKYYLIRTAVLFGFKGQSMASKRTFVDLMLELSNKNGTIKAVSNEINSVTYALDLARQVKWLLENSLAFGIYHFVNNGEASWYDLAKKIFKLTSKDINLVSVAASELPRPALRPKKSVLLNTKSPVLRPWPEALREYLLMKNI